MTSNQQIRISKNARRCLEGLAFMSFDAYVDFMAGRNPAWKQYRESVKEKKETPDETEAL